MHNVEINVYAIGGSQPNHTEIRRWLNDIGAVSCKWPEDDSVNLTGAESLIGLAAKRCYMSFSVEDGLNPNVTKIRKDWTEYFNNILKSGHGSVCEHATCTFAIEGVSRVFTGEMNRHRAGVAISEGSMRYIRFNDIPWWIPNSLRLTPKEREILGKDITNDNTKEDFHLAMAKQRTHEVFCDVFTYCQDRYIELVKIWDLDNKTKIIPFHFKKVVTSCLRRIIPMGVATGGVWTLNIRALRHIMAIRTSAAAEEEIAEVCGKIAKIMVEKEPRLYGDFVQTPEGWWVPKYHKV